MEPIKQEFMPKPSDLRFFSKDEGKRYAEGAGFTVEVDGNRYTATREDMPEDKFVLAKDRDEPDKFVWIRR